ncbi:g606 [Coccomyxa viridis]|uniref:G606 protein n=1 Tax=Coccomyxa viridis TaxID=1274662 RepID=A0ABP1FLI3_9CHLO
MFSRLFRPNFGASSAREKCWHSLRDRRISRTRAQHIRCDQARPLTLSTAAGGPCNTERLDLTDNLYTYLLEHTKEPRVLRQLREATAEEHAGRERNQVAPEQGRFLAWLVEALGVRSAIEIGVFTGYSSLTVALALPEKGCLVACERDEQCMQLAREFWTAAGVSHKIEERMGPAVEALQALLDEGKEDSFDFAFIDADKRSYQAYFDQLLRLVRPGGVIVVDNVLWYGRVADPQDMAKNTVAVRCFNDALLQDDRVSERMPSMSDAFLRGALIRGPPFVASHRSPGRSSRAEQRKIPAPIDGKVIITAGPERSGSTWLFNAVRLLCHDAEQPLDPFWISHLTDSHLQDRGSAQGPHILVKTHAWSDDWDPRAATHTFLTHRDLRGVLASYQRVGWAFDISQAYVEEHMRWREIAQHDFAFEDIVSKPAQQLQILAQRLGIQPRSEWTALVDCINALKPPSSGPPDPVTKLWPRHLSKEVTAQQQGGSVQPSSASLREGRRSLKERFPEYFACYGYD